ncbi:marine proteobacterial sortase target protein [Shewanella avicenniae]|uniref:Marine proteobacterial sortase target protein n=1 Tax=Shewanella avicenniae TaxID=2814294 RepID=A0ABX7QWK8_9GAMM|nr:marine proteobacterial sortase target protein [Shewanella avicenniae]QSX35046.1 marine proteobacterial sortase target protein [Shewanella avicenniae]
MHTEHTHGQRDHALAEVGQTKRLFQPIWRKKEEGVATEWQDQAWFINSVLSAGLLLLALTLLNLMNSVSALAQASFTLQPNPDWPGSGTLQLFSVNGEVTAPKLTTQVAMNITGWTNRVSVTQRYTNVSQDWLHGRYLFPLPENAAVDSLRMKIGERLIEGQIHPKQQAREIYEQAKQAGKQASLLSQQRPNLFTSEVANLAPGETIEVTFSYQQQVDYRDGALSVRFPMTYTPRYLPNADTAQGQAALAEISSPMLVPASASNSEDSTEAASVSINVSLDAGMALASAGSSSHQMTLFSSNGTREQLRLETPAVADRDFIFDWQPANGAAPQAVLFSQQGQTHASQNPFAAMASEPSTTVSAPSTAQQDYSLLMLMPPQAKPRHEVRRELVLVVDKSGSMSGASMQQAKDAVRFALTSLQPQDTFNVLAFSSDVSALSRQSLPATAANIGRAQQFVLNLDADGGTNIAAALELALPAVQENQSDVLRQVIFMTDGAVGNEQELFDFIAARLGDSRLFTVGIGSAPNAYFMKRAAAVGRGTFTYIGNTQEVASKTVALLNKIAAPVVTDVQIHNEDGTVPDYWPARIPDLYLGEPVVVSLKQAAGRHQALTISGNVDGQFWQQQLSLTPRQQDSGLDLLWARAQIGALELSQDGSNRERIKQQVTALALKYHLVSTYTSLVAVDVTPVNPDAEQSLTADIASRMPAGWVKPMGVMPQTGTNSRLWLLMGCVLALLAWGLMWLSRRSRGALNQSVSSI